MINIKKGSEDSSKGEHLINLHSNNRPIFNFNKIKTPQGVSNQIKIKFNRDSSKEQLLNPT